MIPCHQKENQCGILIHSKVCVKRFFLVNEICQTELTAIHYQCKNMFTDI